ncbi:E3 ubiquitin protein ligase DRIP2-like [Tasmannia lanceolata]|uniref:E3 ubiquitin protein ligase DRIP2-like n=1 Tax=Tasmannia lanceolata TaxID=3420 RepID=UPI004064A35E
MMTNHYVKVKRSALVNCLNCPLCLNRLREATTICVCLHTFCKDCIYQKLEEDETYCCPICNVYLGCLPQDKLRPDNNLQELRMKIFPSKKSKEVENPSTLTIPTKRKEKSLSSLVTSTNPVSTKPGKGRAKATPKRGGLLRGIVGRAQANRDLAEGKNHLNRSYSIDCTNMSSVGSKKQRVSGDGKISQVSGTAFGSSAQINTCLPKTGKDPSWDLLTFLAETANKTDDSNSALLGLPVFKGENNDKMDMKKVKNLKRRARKPISSDERKETGKIRRSNTIGERLEPDSTGAVKVLGSEKWPVAKTSESGSSDQSQEKSHPVWFALLASKDQNGQTYPQIPKCYIRTKDGTVTVSYIKRYLVQKLNLKDESEVEVMCCGQTLVSSATLNSLFDIWVLHAAKPDWVSPWHMQKCQINSSTHNFVMVLTYRRGK